jgi:hypothetical protein
MKKLLSLLFVLICTTSILANMAAPSQGGNSVSEPTGVKNVSILHERLTIDFTQLGDENVKLGSRFIDVEATYEIDNPANIQNLDLVFVIASESDNFQFFLDEAEVKTEAISNSEFGDKNTWKLPRETPYDGKNIMYNPYNGNLKSAKFSLNLSKGKHFLKAKYKAKPTVHQAVGLTKGWQFAYSLAPARDWKSFGGLEMNVKIPNNWKFFSNLKLEQTGDVLSGKFNEIPADFFAATTQMPPPENYNSVSDFYFNLTILILVLFPLLIIGLAFWKGYKLKNGWAYGFLAGILWSVSIALVGYLTLYEADKLIPSSQTASYGYGDGIGILLLIILVPIVFAISTLLWVGAYFAAGKLRKQP